MKKMTVTALALLLAVGCTGGGEGGGKGKGKGKGRRGEAMPVTLAAVQAKTEVRQITFVSSLYGRQQADVFSKVSGRVSYIGVEEGQRVKKDQILFRIDRNDPGTTFLETPVPSPLSGWLGRLMVTNVGAQITPNEPLATVVDDAFLRSRVYVPASDWTKISHDTRVTVTVNGVAREGKVVAIARAAQAESGRGSLVVEVPNEDQQWRAGMVAHITLEVEPRERILINASALTITDKGAHVFTVEDGKAKKQEVTFRLLDSDTAEVLTGLKDGDQVVVVGANQLSDGAAVQVVEPSDPSKPLSKN